MWWLIILSVLSIFDIYIIVSYFDGVLNRKQNFRWFIFLTIIYAIALDFLKTIEIFPFFIAFLSLAVYFSLTFFFIADWKQRLFYPILIIAFELAAELVIGFTMQEFFGLNLNEVVGDGKGAYYLAGSIVSKLLFLLFVQIMRRIHVVKNSTIPFSNWLFVMIVPVISIIMQYAVGFDSNQDNEIGNYTHIIMLFGLLAINALAFVVYDKFSFQAQMLVENERKKSRMESEVRQYEFIVSQSKEMAAFMHDTKNHFSMLSDMLFSHKNSEALEYLDTLNITTRTMYSDIIAPNNFAIDTILRRKIADAQRETIDVKHDVLVPLGLLLNDMAICVILGNALDNAIEACLNLVEKQSRFIDISIHYEINRLAIRIANSSSHVEIKDGVCQTTKEHKSAHGFGIENIRNMVEQNNGNMVIQYREGVFTLIIVFFL